MGGGAGRPFKKSKASLKRSRRGLAPRRLRGWPPRSRSEEIFWVLCGFFDVYGFWALGFGLWALGSGLSVLGSRFLALGSGLSVLGSRFWALGSGL